jgi:hypothetical protein
VRRDRFDGAAQARSFGSEDGKMTRLRFAWPGHNQLAVPVATAPVNASMSPASPPPWPSAVEARDARYI